MKKFDQLVRDSKTIIIISSQPLDFDSIASGLILKKYLEFLNKKVRLYFPYKLNEEQREYNSFLPFFDEVIDKDTRAILKNKEADLLILLDGCNLVQFYDYQDTTKPNPSLSCYDKIIRIDHHLQNPEKLENLLIRDPKACSTVEVLLTKIIPHHFINKEIATLAYAALAGDTGNFSWNFNVTTLRLASLLLSKGVNPLIIVDRIFNFKPMSYLKMMLWMYQHIECMDNIASMFLPIPYQIIKEDNLDGAKLEVIKSAFVNEIARKIRTIDRGFILIEKNPGDIYISARGSSLSNKINLPKMLIELGGNGGGHFNASAIDVHGSFEQVKIDLIRLIKAYLKS